MRVATLGVALYLCASAGAFHVPPTHQRGPIARRGAGCGPKGWSSRQCGVVGALTASDRRVRTALAATGPAGLIAAASQVVNWGAISHNAASLGMLALVVAVHELGHFIGARSQGIKVRDFSIGFGPSLVSFKKGDVQYNIRAIPAGGFVAFPEHYNVTDSGDITVFEDKDLLQNRPPLQQAVVISAGVIANVILSFSLLLGSVSSTGLARPEFSEGPVVVRLVEKDAPAAKGGLKPDDIILAVNGKKVKGDDKGLQSAVSLISESGDRVELDLRRNGEVIHKSIAPRVSPTGRSSIGVQMAARVNKVDLLKATTPMEAVQYSWEEFSNMLNEATSSIQRFRQRGVEGLTGPLGIVQAGADLAAVDPTALIKFAAFISINLAVVNALPFPGLDGGQMVFVLIELIRGKRLSPQVENSINAVAILMLASLSLYLVAGDINRGASQVQKALEAAPLDLPR